MATHLSILAWRIPMDRGARRASVHGVAKTQLSMRFAFPYGKGTHFPSPGIVKNGNAVHLDD